MMQDKIFFDSKSQIGIEKVPINSKRKFKFDEGGGVSGSVNVGDVGYLKRNKSSLATVVKVTPKLVYYTLAGTSKTKSLYKEDFVKSFNEVKGLGEKESKKETVTIVETSQSQTTDEVDYLMAFKIYNDTEFENGVLQITNPYTDASSRRDLKLAYDYSLKKGHSKIDSEEDKITINDVDNIRSYLAFNMSYPQILEDIEGDKIVESIKDIAFTYDLASSVVIMKLMENPKEGAQYNKALEDLLQYVDAKSKLSGENSELIKKIDDKIEELSTEVSSLGLFSPKGYFETYFLMNQNNIDDLKILNKAIPFKPVFNFSLWFNGSIVVDEYGNPLEVYHGSKNEGFSNFKFDVFPGVYFAQKKSYSEWFARLGPKETLFSCYLNVKNPIDLTTFGLDKVKYEEFVAYVELKYKYKLQENKALRAFSDAKGGIWAWQYLRGGIDWLKQIIKDGVFDGLKFYENNPDDNSEGQENSTIAWMVFKPQQIKAASGNLLYSNYSDDIRFKKGGQL